MNIKDFMMQDHHRIEETLNDFLSNQDPGSARTLEMLKEIKTAIERHMAWEEEALLPCIESSTGMHMPGPSDLIRSQHRQMRALLESIHIQIVHKKGIEALQKELADLLTLHRREEERILYPWVDTCLSEEEREAALNKMKQSPELRPSR